MNGLFGTATVVTDLDEGKRVSVSIKSAEQVPESMQERLTETRARARALIAAGFAEEGFIRNRDLAVDVPQIERRTEIVDKFQTGDNEWNYTINVRPGVVLQ